VLSQKTKAQQASSLLIGKWKFVRIEFAGKAVFDLENLTQSYKDFFNAQKDKAEGDSLTVNDSLHINYRFEKTVNDVSKMFIRFTAGKRYVTNKYSKTGEITDSTETGTFIFNPLTKSINTYRNGKRNERSVYKVVSLHKSRLVIQSGEVMATKITCRKATK
jgi:hypothetical protein